jgi:hypothetical protein
VNTEYQEMKNLEAILDGVVNQLTECKGRIDKQIEKIEIEQNGQQLTLNLEE